MFMRGTVPSESTALEKYALLSSSSSQAPGRAPQISQSQSAALLQAGTSFEPGQNDRTGGHLREVAESWTPNVPTQRRDPGRRGCGLWSVESESSIVGQ